MVLSENTQATRAAFFTQLYLDVFPIVARYVHRRGGGLEDAKDIFQEALIAYYEKSRQATTLWAQQNPKGYLMRMCQNLWIDRYKASAQLIPMGMGLPEPQSQQEQSYGTEKVLYVLETAGQRCMELLKSFYYDKLDMETLSLRFGYTSVRFVTVQKFKCLEKIRAVVKEKSYTYESFVD